MPDALIEEAPDLPDVSQGERALLRFAGLACLALLVCVWALLLGLIEVGRLDHASGQTSSLRLDVVGLVAGGLYLLALLQLCLLPFRHVRWTVRAWLATLFGLTCLGIPAGFVLWQATSAPLGVVQVSQVQARAPTAQAPPMVRLAFSPEAPFDEVRAALVNALRATTEAGELTAVDFELGEVGSSGPPARVRFWSESMLRGRIDVSELDPAAEAERAARLRTEALLDDAALASEVDSGLPVSAAEVTAPASSAGPAPGAASSATRVIVDDPNIAIATWSAIGLALDQPDPTPPGNAVLLAVPPQTRWSN